LEKRLAELSEQPRARFGDDRAEPRREFDQAPHRDSTERPRTFERDDWGQRPQRSGFDRPRTPYADRPRSNFGERSSRSFNDRPPYRRQRDTESRPAPRRDWEERAPRRSWDERPPRQDR
jgi:hypothetical protein